MTKIIALFLLLCLPLPSYACKFDSSIDYATDIVYIARHILKVKPIVPPVWRDFKEIPSEADIAENIERAMPYLDLDEDGTVEVTKDIVYLARRLTGLSAVPHGYSADSVLINKNLDKLCELSRPISLKVKDKWAGFRKDEKHSAYSKIQVDPPFTREHVIKNVVGKYDQFQADSIISSDETVSIITALQGGLPATYHGPSRGVMHLDKKLIDSGSGYYDTVYAQFFSTNLGGPIETSEGTIPWTYGPYKLKFFESGWNNCTRSFCSRIKFDTYGTQTGRDDNSDVWRTSWTAWHNSTMWSSTDRCNLWSWGTPVPVGNESSTPHEYTRRADGVWVGKYLITNQVLDAANRSAIKPGFKIPEGGKGITVWDTETCLPVKQLDGTFGMLSADSESIWVLEQDWRTGEETFEVLKSPVHSSNGKTLALTRYSVPDLEKLVTITGFNTPDHFQEPPIVTESRIIYIGSRDGTTIQLYAYNKLGQLLWTRHVDSWRKRQECSYYRADFVSSTAAAGDIVVHAGQGLTFINLRDGRVLQKVDDGYYFNPVFIDGDLYVIKTHGNIVSYIDADTPDRVTLLAEGYVDREWEAGRFLMKFDGPPAPVLKVPKKHTFVSCGGNAVEIWQGVIQGKSLLDVG